MYEWKSEYSDVLTRKLKKLKQKNPKQFSIVIKKRDEIKQIIPQNPEHYKFLRKDMKGFKRVHIDKHFILVFKVDKAQMVIRFEDYDHHDKIYKRIHELA
ncbi:MAG: hypothetical protein KJ767_02695 [Nanoarchaeota archaeon]|nr:hypothetical protein [Nanoarchaeota archaeon]